jgi:hypothetical protein
MSKYIQVIKVNGAGVRHSATPEEPELEVNVLDYGGFEVIGVGVDGTRTVRATYPSGCAYTQG